MSIYDEPRPVSVEEFEQGGRYCICADPENCTEAVPGRIRKAGLTASKIEWRCFVMDHPWAGTEPQECDYPNCGCDPDSQSDRSAE